MNVGRKRDCGSEALGAGRAAEMLRKVLVRDVRMGIQEVVAQLALTGVLSVGSVVVCVGSGEWIDCRRAGESAG